MTNNKLSLGNLYRTTSTYNVKTNIFNEQFEVISKITSNAVMLLIDDRYFYVIYSAISDGNIFVPCKDLDEEKRCRSEFGAYIKIAYNNMIGYVNYFTLSPIE